MYKNKKVVVVLPAYNAEKTLEKTYLEIPHEIVDEVIYDYYYGPLSRESVRFFENCLEKFFKDTRKKVEKMNKCANVCSSRKTQERSACRVRAKERAFARKCRETQALYASKFCEARALEEREARCS